MGLLRWAKEPLIVVPIVEGIVIGMHGCFCL